MHDEGGEHPRMVVHQGEEGGRVCGYVSKAQNLVENANLSTFSILGDGRCCYVKFLAPKELYK